MKVNVEVFPGSRKKKIKFISDKKFEIYIREKAENNLANKKVLEIISEIYQVNKRDIKIISGHKITQKVVKINNL